MSLSTTQYGYIVDPMVPFTDDKGKTIKNGFIRVFMAGTSTPVLTYRNYDGATNQEKIELDNSGRVMHNVIGSKGSLYKVVVYNILHSQENPLLTVDKIAVLGASINATGATIVTGLDSVTVQEENFLKATVEGTGVELALDPTEVTSEVNTISDAATAAPDVVVPLLDKTGTGDSKKISLANIFKFALDWISRLATTITSFASGDVFVVSNPTDGSRKMSKDTLLELTAQNALAGNVAPAFDSLKSYSVGESVANDGMFGVFTENHSAGSWTGKDVATIPEALVASSILTIEPISLTGIATEVDEGNIVRQDIYTDGKTKVYLKVPSIAWDVSYVLYRYCFTCGYVDGDNVAHDVVTATAATLSTQIGKTIELPSGYSQYYVCMRGNSGTVATFNFLKLEPLEDKIKNLSKLITRNFSLDVTGADSAETVVQWPCYGVAKFSVKMPSTYNASNLGTYNTAFAVGYYEVVKESGEPRTALVNLNKTQVQSYLDKTIEVNIPSTAKSVFLFARCNTGTTLHFDAKLVQNNYDETSSISAEVRNIELDFAVTKSDETAYRHRLSALKYNFVDLRASDLQEGEASMSDFPSGMKHKSSLSITAKPVARDIAGRTASNGMCISSDGKILVAHAAPGTYIFGIGDLYKDSFTGFTKTLYVGGAIHANYMWFGSEKYSESDKYPLLYVGGLVGGDGVGSTINVLRIVGDLESAATCSFTLVQTITIDSSYGPIADIQKWGDKLVAWYNEYLYVFDSFPAHTAGNVTLTGGTAYELDGYTFRDPPQSGCIVGDSLYEIAGYGNGCYLVVIDLTSKNCKQVKMPSYGEWETLCYFNDLFFAMTIANDTNLAATELVVCSLEFML